jgi:predicted RNA-binding Zn ribbon-like protein
MVSNAGRTPAELRVCGGLRCLDFLNTVDWRGRSEPVEYLSSYEDLLTWSALSGVLSSAQARVLERSVRKNAATRVLAGAIDFREAAYRALVALLNRRTPARRDLETVDAMVSQARDHTALRYDRGAFSWSFADADREMHLPLWIIAIELAELLASEHVRDVRMCGGPECGWLFLDTTKNHTRRWCSMEGCGNRAKARRFYARTH